MKNFCIVYKSVPVQYSSCSLKQPIIIQSRRLIYMLSTLTLPYVAERQTLMSCDIQNLITMILVCHFFFYFSQISSLKLQVAQLSNSQCLILLYIITELTLHATADSNLLRPVSETQYVIILGLTKLCNKNHSQAQSGFCLSVALLDGILDAIGGNSCIHWGTMWKQNNS